MNGLGRHDERSVDLDKVWHGLHRLLTGSASDVASQAIFGGELVDEDLGYGTPRLPPEYFSVSSKPEPVRRHPPRRRRPERPPCHRARRRPAPVRRPTSDWPGAPPPPSPSPGTARRARATTSSAPVSGSRPSPARPSSLSALFPTPRYVYSIRGTTTTPEQTFTITR